jgi:hypothetical protein
MLGKDISRTLVCRGVRSLLGLLQPLLVRLQFGVGGCCISLLLAGYLFQILSRELKHHRFTDIYLL